MSESLLKHPPSLRVFFATEMWERYGFYVVQTLLALYLALDFKWDDERVFALVGSFTAMTYLSAIVGGVIADRYLGQKRAILLGAFILLISYLSLMLVHSQLSLMAALAIIPVGTGLLKTNISSLLGNEYPPESARKESGFTIFYMGITTGIILGSTIPSFLKEYFGWPLAFFSAAFGMIIALFVFSLGIKRYEIKDYYPFPMELSKLFKALFLIILLWSLAFYILSSPHLANIFFCLVVLSSVGYLILTFKQEALEQSRKTRVIGILCLISAMFWAFYFQMFLSLTLLISRIVSPELWGLLFPPPYYVGVQSLGMLVFGYLLARRKRDALKYSGVEIGKKFLFAMFLMSLTYFLILLATYQSQGSALLLSPLFLLIPYLIISLAELLLSPVGLAAITSLASRSKVSTMMGIFFVSLGVGAFLSGKLAAFTAIEHPESLSLQDLKAHYLIGFSYLFLILLGATTLCFFLNKVIKRLLAGEP